MGGKWKGEGIRAVGQTACPPAAASPATTVPVAVVGRLHLRGPSNN